MILITWISISLAADCGRVIAYVSAMETGRPLRSQVVDGGFGQKLFLRTNVDEGHAREVLDHAVEANRFFGQSFQLPKKLQIVRPVSSPEGNHAITGSNVPTVFVPKRVEHPNYKVGKTPEPKRFKGMFDHEMGHVLFEENLPKDLRNHDVIKVAREMGRLSTRDTEDEYLRQIYTQKIAKLQSAGGSEERIQVLRNRLKKLSFQEPMNPKIAEIQRSVNLDVVHGTMYSEELFSDLAAMAHNNRARVVVRDLIDEMKAQGMSRAELKKYRTRDGTRRMSARRWRGEKQNQRRPGPMDKSALGTEMWEFAPIYKHTFFAPVRNHVWQKHLRGRSRSDRARILKTVYDQIVGEMRHMFERQAAEPDQYYVDEIATRNQDLIRRIDRALSQ